MGEFFSSIFQDTCFLLLDRLANVPSPAFLLEYWNNLLQKQSGRWDVATVRPRNPSNIYEKREILIP